MVSSRLLSALAMGWQSLCFLSIAILLPQALLPAGVIGTVVGIGLTIVAVTNGRSTWIKLSLLSLWVDFFFLLISQTVNETIEVFLPVTLLQFIMVLFSVELLATGSRYQTSSSAKSLETATPGELEVSIDRSILLAFRRVSRVGLLLATSYLFSLGVLYLSTYATLTAPLLADISIYIIVVSVALALLMLSREE